MTFKSVRRGPNLSFGPPCWASGGAFEVSCTYQGLGLFAIGEDANVYALCVKHDDNWPTGTAQPLYWLRVPAAVATL